MVDISVCGHTEEPLGDWLRRVHTFLTEASLEALTSLSEETISLCTRRWRTAMNKSKPNSPVEHSDWVDVLFAAHMASCLQRHQQSFSNDGSSIGTHPVACDTLRNWVDRCASVFKDPEVLDTVICILRGTLQLIWKGQHQPYCETAIQLAGKTLSAVPVPWTDANVTKYMCKLAQKFDQGLPSLKMACLPVLTAPNTKVWLSNVGKALQTVLSHITSGQCLDLMEAEKILLVVCQCITEEAAQTDAFDGVFQDLCTFIVEQCRPQRTATPDKVAAMLQARMFVRVLTQTERVSAAPQMLLQTLAQRGLPDWWSLDMSTPGSPENCCGAQVCVNYDEDLRQELRDELSFLLLATAASNGSRLPHSVLSVVHVRLGHSSSSERQPYCAYQPFVAQQRPKLPGASAVTSMNWRECVEMFNDLSGVNGSRLIEDVIAAITKDLQERCDDAERPLRAALEDANHLREQVRESDQRMSTIVSEKHSLEIALQKERHLAAEVAASSGELNCAQEALQQQFSEATQQIESMRAEAVAASTSYQALQEAAQRKAAAELNQLKQNSENQLLKVEATLRVQEQKCAALEQANTLLEDSMRIKSREMEAEYGRRVKDMRQQFDRETSQWQMQIEESNGIVSSRDLEINRLTELVSTNDQAISQLRQQHQTAASNVTALESDLLSERANTARLQQKLTDTESTRDQLTIDLHQREAELEAEIDSRTEMENAAVHWEQQYLAVNQALDDARKREEGIQALLGGAVGSGAGFGRGFNKSPVKGRRATSAVLPRHSMQHAPAPVMPPRFLNGTVTPEEDDESSFEDEIAEL